MILIVFFSISAIDHTEELVFSELEKAVDESAIVSASYISIASSSTDEKAEEDYLKKVYESSQASIFVFNTDGTIRTQHRGQGLNNVPHRIAAHRKFINFLFDKSRSLPVFSVKDTVETINDLPFSSEINSIIPSVNVYKAQDKTMRVIVYRPMLNGSQELQGIMALIYNKVHTEEILTKLRVNMINTILISLILISLLSLYLAAYIGHPLRRLAIAAESIRQGEGQYQDIPDFSDRNDEISILSDTLRAMTEELIKRIDSIDSFAADVAHELKNPLTSLRSALETSSKIKDKKKQEKLLSIMLHDLDRMDRLITDISRASRLDKELSSERFEPYEISQIVQDTINYMQQLIDRDKDKSYAGIELVGDMINVKVKLNIGGMMQVIENILSNALSFSPIDKPVKVSISEWSDPNVVELKIRDHGSGIAANDIDRIFERFYTERREDDSFGQHSGLGLSICKQIVELHGGTIKAENHPAGGAVFSIVLPIYEEG